MQSRPATRNDLDAVQLLLQQAGLPAQDCAAHIDNFVVFEDRLRIVAVGGLEIHNDSALLRSLAVLPAYRGRGLGNALYRTLKKRAREAGIKNLYILTQDAEDFFTRLGFTPVARDQAPASIQATRQFSGLCPSSAKLLRSTTE